MLYTLRHLLRNLFHVHHWSKWEQYVTIIPDGRLPRTQQRRCLKCGYRKVESI